MNFYPNPDRPTSLLVLLEGFYRPNNKEASFKLLANQLTDTDQLTMYAVSFDTR